MNTRTLTAILRRIAASTPRGDTEAGIRRHVELSRAYRRRRYMLAHDAPTISGHTILIDATAREAWIVPAQREADSLAHDMHRAAAHVRREHVRMARETGYLDALFDALDALGYTLTRGSETRETLAAYRATRRPAFLDA